MAHGALTPEEIAALVAADAAPTRAKSKPISDEEKEFRRWHPYFSDLSGKYITRHDTFPPNKRLNCLSRGCGVRTVWKVQGIPKCDIHALLALGILLDQKDGVALKFEQEGHTEP